MHTDTFRASCGAEAVLLISQASRLSRLCSSCRNPQQRLHSCMRLIAKMPTLAALAYRTATGLPIIYPRNDLVRLLP